MVTFSTPEEVNSANGNKTPEMEWQQGVRIDDVIIESKISIDLNKNIKDCTEQCVVKKIEHAYLKYEISKPFDDYIEGCVRVVYYDVAGNIVGTDAYYINKYSEWENNKTYALLEPMEREYADYKLYYNFSKVY